MASNSRTAEQPNGHSKALTHLRARAHTHTQRIRQRLDNGGLRLYAYLTSRNFRRSGSSRCALSRMSGLVNSVWVGGQLALAAAAAWIRSIGASISRSDQSSGGGGGDGKQATLAVIGAQAASLQCHSESLWKCVDLILLVSCPSDWHDDNRCICSPG